MTNWRKSSTRKPPKTKAELRQMLAEAVRNTDASPEQGTKRTPKGSRLGTGVRSPLPVH